MPYTVVLKMMGIESKWIFANSSPIITVFILLLLPRSCSKSLYIRSSSFPFSHPAEFQSGFLFGSTCRFIGMFLCFVFNGSFSFLPSRSVDSSRLVRLLFWIFLSSMISRTYASDLAKNLGPIGHCEDSLVLFSQHQYLGKREALAPFQCTNS